jgi:putative membrane protein
VRATMIRLIVRTAISLVGNAFGLIVAAAVLDDMTLDVSGFIVAVIVFTIAFALLQPFLVVQARSLFPAAIGGIALVATFISLVITVAISDGISISGVVTWIAATFIVWLAALVAMFILPFLGLKKYLDERR